MGTTRAGGAGAERLELSEPGGRSDCGPPGQGCRGRWSRSSTWFGGVEWELNPTPCSACHAERPSVCVHLCPNVCPGRKAWPLPTHPGSGQPSPHPLLVSMLGMHPLSHLPAPSAPPSSRFQGNRHFLREAVPSHPSAEVPLSAVHFSHPRCLPSPSSSQRVTVCAPPSCPLPLWDCELQEDGTTCRWLTLAWPALSATPGAELDSVNKEINRQRPKPR